MRRALLVGIDELFADPADVARSTTTASRSRTSWRSRTARTHISEVAILSASRSSQPSLELGDHGFYTELVCSALGGGAADIGVLRRLPDWFGSPDADFALSPRHE